MSELQAQINDLVNRNRAMLLLAAAVTAVLVVAFAGNELGRLTGTAIVVVAISLVALIIWAKTNNVIYALVALVAGFWAGNQGLFDFGANVGGKIVGTVQGLLQLGLCIVFVLAVIVALFTIPVWLPRLLKALGLS